MIMYKHQIRVAYLLYGLGLTGAPKSTLKVIRNLNDQFKPIIICIGAGGPLEHELREINIEYHIINKEKLYDITIYISLYKLLKSCRIHIVHTQLYPAHYFGRIAGYLAKIPVIISTYRNSSDWITSKALKYTIKQNIDKITAKYFTDALIGVSEGVKNHYLKQGYRGKKFEVIFNSIDLNSISKDKDSTIHEEFKISKSDKVIVSIGRLTKQKGYEYLISAFSKLLKRVSNVKLIIFGLDQSNGTYQQLAKQYGVDEFIIFSGTIKNIYDILIQADLFVSSSLWEGLPRAHLEALLCGCMVVSTDIGGSNEVIINDYNGLLVKPGSIDELTDAMLEILTNKENYLYFKENGMKVLNDKFDIKKNNLKLESLYLSILDSKISKNK